MTITSALILDLVLLAIVIVTVIVAANRGFLATVLKLCGTALALIASWFAADHLSAAVFDNFFKNNMVEQTSQMLSESGQVSVQAIVDKLTAFLPDSLVEQLLGSTQQLQGMLDSDAPGVATQVVEQVVAPLVLPIISVVVFFVVFAISNVLIGFLVSALTNVNRIPLMGGLNRTLGVVAGLVLGIIYVLLALCALWAVVVITGDGLPYFNSTVMEGSLFYQFFSKYNPFI